MRNKEQNEVFEEVAVILMNHDSNIFNSVLSRHHCIWIDLFFCLYIYNFDTATFSW